MKHQSVIVLNLGGSKALVVAKRIRECGVYSEVYPYSMEKEESDLLMSRALMHSFKASKLLLISAPSILQKIQNQLVTS